MTGSTGTGRTGHSGKGNTGSTGDTGAASVRAYAAITLQSLITGFSFMFLKIALQSADTFDLLAHRFTLAALSVLLFALLRPGALRIRFRDFLKILPYGIAYPLVFFLFQTLGMTQISSSQAGIIYAVVPILTVIAAGMLLGEKIRGTQAFFMLLSVAGVIFINIMNGFNLKNYSFAGFFLILISAVSLALYNVLVRRLTGDYTPLAIACVMNITGFLFFNVIALARHTAAGTVTDYFLPFASPSFLVAVLFLGVLSSLITSLLSAFALKTLQAVRVGLFNNVGTIVSILAGTLFLHEEFRWYHLPGIIAILTGTIAFNLIGNGGKRESGEEDAASGPQKQKTED